MKSFTIQEIGSLVNGRVTGSAIQKFGGLEQVTKAGSNQITFIGNRKYAGMWAKSAAGAAIVNEGILIEPDENRALVYVKNADLAMYSAKEQGRNRVEEHIDTSPTKAVSVELLRDNSGPTKA